MENAYFIKITQSSNIEKSSTVISNQDLTLFPDINKWIEDLIKSIQEKEREILFKNAENESLKILLNLYRSVGDPSEYEQKKKEINGIKLIKILMFYLIDMRNSLENDKKNQLLEIESLKIKINEEKLLEVNKLKENLENSYKEKEEYKYLTNKLNEQILILKQELTDFHKKYDSQSKILLSIEAEKKVLYENNSKIQHDLSVLNQELINYEKKIEKYQNDISEVKIELNKREEENIKTKEELEKYYNLSKQINVTEIKEYSQRLRKDSEDIFELNRLQLKNIENFENLNKNLVSNQKNEFSSNLKNYSSDEISFNLNTIGFEDFKFDEELIKIEKLNSKFDFLNKLINQSNTDKIPIRKKNDLFHSNSQSISLPSNNFKNKMVKIQTSFEKSEKKTNIYLRKLKSEIIENDIISPHIDLKSEETPKSIIQQNNEEKNDSIFYKNENKIDKNIEFITPINKNETLKKSLSFSQIFTINKEKRKRHADSAIQIQGQNLEKFNKINDFKFFSPNDKNKKIELENENFNFLHNLIERNICYFQQKIFLREKLKEFLIGIDLIRKNNLNEEKFDFSKFSNEINIYIKNLNENLHIEETSIFEIINNNKESLELLNEIFNIFTENKIQLREQNKDIKSFSNKINELNNDKIEIEKQKKQLEENINNIIDVFDKDKINEIINLDEVSTPKIRKKTESNVMSKFKRVVDTIIEERNELKSQNLEINDISIAKIDLEKINRKLKRENANLILKFQTLQKQYSNSNKERDFYYSHLMTLKKKNQNSLIITEPEIKNDNYDISELDDLITEIETNKLDIFYKSPNKDLYKKLFENSNELSNFLGNFQLIESKLNSFLSNYAN